MDYVKDRWYKLNGNWYAKFNKTIKVNGVIPRTDWAYTESITLNKTYGNHPNASIDIANLKSIKLADMNQVSKYLPDNHPDKVNSISEYIECIDIGYYINSCSIVKYNILKVGNIYKVSNVRPASTYPKRIVLETKEGLIEIGCNQYETLYKPSTKEAYEAQNSNQFIVGNWYKCSCNTNLYRFHSIKDNKYFVNDARINPTNKTQGDCDFIGYKEGLIENSLLSYFSPANKADMEIVNIYLPNNQSTNFKVGNWVVSLGDFISFKRGSIGQITEVTDGYGLNAKSFKISTQTFTNDACSWFRLATQDEIGNYLISEAKKKYPEDTLFIPAHLSTTKETCLRRPEYHFYYEKDIIYLKNEQGLVVNNNVGQSYVVYHNGKWAEIVSKPEEVKWQIGGWVKCLYDIGDCKKNYYYQITAVENLNSTIKVNTLKNQILGIINGFGIFIQCEWIGMERSIEIVNHSNVGLEFPYSCGSHNLNSVKMEYLDYNYNEEQYNQNKSKIKLIKVEPLQQVKELRQSKKSKLITI